MFWALAQREKDRQRWREEALREGREDERARIERELAQRGIEVPREALEIIRTPQNGSSRVGEA